jgi:mRNA interferase MazF
MKRGDICLARFPYTDASGFKMRPVLVVSANAFNAGEDVVVLPISSAPDLSDKACVFIDKASVHFKMSGLKAPSAIKFSKPMTISKRVIPRRLGQLHDDILSDVAVGLISVIT